MAYYTLAMTMLKNARYGKLTAIHYQSVTDMYISPACAQSYTSW